MTDTASPSCPSDDTSCITSSSSDGFQVVDLYQNIPYSEELSIFRRGNKRSNVRTSATRRREARSRSSRECQKLQQDLEEVSVRIIRDEMMRKSFIRSELYHGIEIEKACFKSDDLLQWSKDTKAFPDFSDEDIVRLGSFLFKQNILKAVYAVIGRFVMGTYFYKFSLDEDIDTGFRRVVMTECTEVYNTWRRDEIHGNTLLERLDHRDDRNRYAQWMLKFGYIKPKHCSNEEDQMFNPKSLYRFAACIRSANLNYGPQRNMTFRIDFLEDIPTAGSSRCSSASGDIRIRSPTSPSRTFAPKRRSTKSLSAYDIRGRGVTRSATATVIVKRATSTFGES